MIHPCDKLLLSIVDCDPVVTLLSYWGHRLLWSLLRTFCAGWDIGVSVVLTWGSVLVLVALFYDFAGVLLLTSCLHVWSLTGLVGR